jgi:hypothetical protein
VTDPLPQSNANERWYAGTNDPGKVLSSLRFALVFHHQYKFTALYSVMGGNSPAYPALKTISLGKQTSQYLFTTPGDYWIDSGSSYSISNLLVGSSSTERWIVSGGFSGKINSPSVGKIFYYHQYLITASYAPLT